ncbi:tripartite tricarboxylate transporter substrate binding protein [Humitalea sp. 24SJ18S-53]|uniref:tripartite tricarboxylate transporter substrate binding protein n=1 Tax=Humitalea sp. 24SJ18S-53 TaxID=3422307 RepID=UPI003D66E558
MKPINGPTRRHVLAAAAALIAAPAAAQDTAFPHRQLRIIVPLAPGGSNDTLGRIMAERLRDSLGQLVFVENRPGAASNLGFELVATSPPDGYTLLLAPDSLTVNPALFQNLRYNAQTSFAPVIQMARAAQMLVVRPALGVSTLAEFIALAKARPGQLNIASPGNASAGHLTGVMLSMRAETRWTHVPYRGGGPAVTDTLAGTVDALWVTPAPAMPHLRSGALRALAVSSLTRATALPEVPTVAEQGFPGFEVINWQGILAPAGTPPAVVQRLNEAMNAVLVDPPIKARLEDLGFEIVGGPPDVLARTIADNLPRWRELIRAANITAD